MALTLDSHTVADLARILQRDRAAMPLVEAAGRRLGVDSWMLRLDDAGRLRGIVLLAPDIPALPARDPEIVPDSRPPAPAPQAERQPPDPFEQLHALPPGGPLARLLGASHATGRQLADLALRSDDAEIRGEAVTVAVDALMRDPAREQRVMAALESIDDATLARSLTGIAGEATAGLLSVVVERARGHPLGERAARVQQARSGTPPRAGLW